MNTSRIEWTDIVWNPVTGCDKVSAGCKFCYAETMAKRLSGMAKQHKYRNGFQVTIHPHELLTPTKWKGSRLVFVGSMCDIFHPEVPTFFLSQLFDTMRSNPQHSFQLLTKRSERLAEIESDLSWPENVWLGVTVERSDYQYRIHHLQQTSANLKWLSIEPLLGAMPSLDMDGIGWVVVGGEAGNSPRPMEADWVRDLRDQCVSKGIPFFFKQWGGRSKKRSGRLLDGRTWNQFPVSDQHNQTEST